MVTSPHVAVDPTFFQKFLDSIEFLFPSPTLNSVSFLVLFKLSISPSFCRPVSFIKCPSPLFRGFGAAEVVQCLIFLRSLSFLLSVRYKHTGFLFHGGVL